MTLMELSDREQHWLAALTAEDAEGNPIGEVVRHEQNKAGIDTAKMTAAPSESSHLPTRYKKSLVGNKTTGLYSKFLVTRHDGKSEPGEKHFGCEYFVLDLTHDPHAKAAITAYAQSCKEEYPLLAADLEQKLHKIQQVTGGKNDTRKCNHHS